MSSNVAQPPAPRLSICITTFNRSNFIGATLDSIIEQSTSDCEIVVLDGGSTDDTERVVSEYARSVGRLRYIRQETNNGFDRDCDRVVELARGEYCWLMTDDDLLKPGAVAAVLQALREDLSLIIVNTEARDFAMIRVLQPRWLDLISDRVYGPDEMDRLVVDTGHVLVFVGCIVIKREVWIARERERYYGSLFTYLGVIFQDLLPGKAMVIAEPFISYRMGNTHTFSPKSFEVGALNFPSVVWSLPLSAAAKSAVCSAAPWRNFTELLLWRGVGSYSLTEYRRLIRPQLRSMREAFIPSLVALLPGVLVNAFFVLRFSLLGRRYRDVWEPAMMLQALRQSPFHLWNWRIFKRWS